MEVKALLKHTRTAPRKARLIAGLIRGRNVNDAINIL
ncbi:MAG: 50S ribosomal protein L22, partial [Nitrospina sp.]|nr:50S ribosomal protein L22 [Nitrospina sp.]